LLFQVSDIEKKEVVTAPALTTSPQPNGKSFTVFGKKVDVLNSIDQIKKNHTLHFCTEGRWSSHELLARLLDLAGPSEVCLTSWALTEEPVRMLVNMKRDNLITELYLVTDKRIKVNNPNAYQLAVANFPNMRLANLHAKVITVVNDNYAISMVSSANFTQNKRFEAGVITEDKLTSEFHRGWIKKIISDGLD